MKKGADTSPDGWIDNREKPAAPITYQYVLMPSLNAQRTDPLVPDPRFHIVSPLPSLKPPPPSSWKPITHQSERNFRSSQPGALAPNVSLSAARLSQPSSSSSSLPSINRLALKEKKEKKEKKHKKEKDKRP